MHTMELMRENQVVQSSPLDCTNDARLDNFYKFLSLSSDTFGGYDMVSLSLAEERMKNISYVPDDVYFQVASVGEWSGVVNVAEYIMLSRKEFNGGFYSLKMREVTGSTCLSQDSVEFETLDTFELSGRAGLTSKLKTRVEFGPGTDLFSSIISDAPKEATESFTGDPRELCDVAVLRCPGDLYPYESLQECYNFMSTLPQACSSPDEISNRPFEGDTVACRYLHLSGAALRPTYHCAHLSKGSSGKCSSKKCPSATRSATIQSLVPEFNASTPAWLLWIEIALIVLMMIIFLVIHLWYRKQRRLFLGVTANAKKAIGEDHKTLPEIKMKNVTFSWTKQFGGKTIFKADNISLGGSQVTALTGPSGIGKSSFMKLLAGFQLDHIELNVGQFVKRTNVLLCDQSSAMWPKEMLVHDIFLFSSCLLGSNLDQVSYIIETLKINEFLGQQFGTLSGGQAQLVHIASAIVSPSPTLIFLDEPFSSLDDRKAIILMNVLKEVSKKCGHSFVTTVHTCSDAITAKFDNFVTLVGEDNFNSEEQLDNSIQLAERFYQSNSSRRSSSIMLTTSNEQHDSSIGSSYFDRAATSNMNNDGETYDLGMKQQNEEDVRRNNPVAELKASE